MKTRITETGDTTTVNLEGVLSFEDQAPLREALHDLVADKAADGKKIIFNFENLDFVGSSGISTFLRTLNEISERNGVEPRYCNVKSEFQRIMNALSSSRVFEFYENEERARKSFDH